MLAKSPNLEEIKLLLGEEKYIVWQDLCAMIDELYGIQAQWNSGGKKWVYEYKYSVSSRTLCAIYIKENILGFMLIFGKNERAKVESLRSSLSEKIMQEYDAATTYHDGKWVMFLPQNNSLFEDFKKLLAIKRKAKF